MHDIQFLGSLQIAYREKSIIGQVLKIIEALLTSAGNMHNYQHSNLWKKSFAHCDDGLDEHRDSLVHAYSDFRIQVDLLLQQIQKELPSLTRHDITHVDSLWHIASEIAGPDWSLNPAEAFVLGGAFLLHDAAHCRAAFPGGLDEIRRTIEWQDVAAQAHYNPSQLQEKSEAFQEVLFDTLRILHPKQARKLAFAEWYDHPNGTPYRLFPHDELRDAYGDIIGEIAGSHWLNPHEIESFSQRVISTPGYLAPARWPVCMLKVAILLRVADAAHLDSTRAPRLLMAMNQPQKNSRDHWLFQARLNQPYCDNKQEGLYITGTPFPVDEQGAWWLAYDAACLVDKELSAADHLLRDHQLDQLTARKVIGIQDPETFSLHVPTDGWHPVDASLHISDIKSVVERFGGTKLYGDNPSLALRELLQNGRDAILACRAIGGLDDKGGFIEVEIQERDGEDWLQVTDTGIGMSRYVLTEVLLDFGRSLWRDPSLRHEWPGLAASNFDAIGRFGIGFFAAFMLGDQIKVVTRRYDPHPNDTRNQWVLEFQQGLVLRPNLRQPMENEELRRPGTRVSIRLKNKKDLLKITHSWFDLFLGLQNEESFHSLGQVVGMMAPALEVDVWTKEDRDQKVKTITAGDWQNIEPLLLMERLIPLPNNSVPLQTPIDKWSVELLENMAARMTTLKDKEGRIWGRCSVEDSRRSLRGFRSGVITVGGILGGKISSFNGILIGEQLDNLNRSVAVPSVPADVLKSWVEEQVEILVKRNELTLYSSKTLLNLGACAEHLFIGSHNYQPMTTGKFRELAASLEELWLIERRNADFNSSEDNVLKSDYENHLELDLKVFFVNDDVSRNEFITESNWPNQKFPDIPRSSIVVIEKTLNDVWKEWECEKGKEVEIGTVFGEPIIREVIICRPSKKVKRP